MNVDEQLMALTLAGAQHAAATGKAMHENLVQGLGVIHNLGIQQINAAALHQQTSLSPYEAFSASELKASKDPGDFARLNAANSTPKA